MAKALQMIEWAWLETPARIYVIESSLQGQKSESILSDLTQQNSLQNALLKQPDKQ